MAVARWAAQRPPYASGLHNGFPGRCEWGRASKGESVSRRRAPSRHGCEAIDSGRYHRWKELLLSLGRTSACG